jgi:hypothetical protein
MAPADDAAIARLSAFTDSAANPMAHVANPGSVRA